MIWALKDNERITAVPKEKASCPLCNQEVISKCGLIKIWHWAHKQEEECDSFGEPETEWHFKWKDSFPKEMQEVILREHRADIRNNKNLILEFQNSPISPDKIKEREDFYNNMIWILNGDTIADNFGLIDKQRNLYGFINKKIESEYKKFFNWKWFPKSWCVAEKPILIDISSWDIDILFSIEKIDNEGTGYGRRISKEAFIIENGGKPWLKEESNGTKDF